MFVGPSRQNEQQESYRYIYNDGEERLWRGGIASSARDLLRPMQEKNMVRVLSV